MLTKRQKEILETIKANPGATLEDIARALGLSSVGNVHAHIQNLIKKDYLKKNGRMLVVKDMGDSPTAYLPYYGEAQCGPDDLFNEDNILDYLPMPRRFLFGHNIDNLFLIKASGDSMEPLIHDGEILLFEKIEQGNTPTLNEIVLCTLDDGLKIKKISLLQSEGHLISVNKAKYNPIPFDANNYVKIHARLVKMKSF